MALRLVRVKDAMSAPQTATKSAFQSFAFAAAPIRTTPR